MLASLAGPHRQWASWALLAAAAGQFALSPVAADGTRPDNWGLYLARTAEVYYPFDKLFAHLAAQGGEDALVVSGAPPDLGDAARAARDYSAVSAGYGGSLLAVETGRAATAAQAAADLAAASARHPAAARIAWAVPPGLDAAAAAPPPGFTVEATFANRQNRIVLFARADGAGSAPKR